MVRVKHRYLIGQVLLEPSSIKTTDFNARDILLAAKDKLQLLFGDVGSGTIGAHLVIKFFDSESMIFVIRATREAANDTWFALSCMNEIKKQTCTVRCLNLSGCERTCFSDLKRLLEVYVRNSPLIIGSNRDKEEEVIRKINEYETLVNNIV